MALNTMRHSTQYPMVDNYIYLHHIDQFLILPTYPEQMQDQLNVKFNSSTPLSRSAPIYSYSDSGPRSIQFTFRFHRDMMTEINYQRSNFKLSGFVDDDYVDTFIRYMQAAALPNYGAAEKLVDPPMVSVRIGNEVFIKGIVNGTVGVSYDLPVLDNGKYAMVEVSFTVYETTPYGAMDVIKEGSFRGINTSLERVWVKGGMRI